MVKRSPKSRRREAESKDDSDSDDDAREYDRRSGAGRGAAAAAADADDDAGLIGKALLATSAHFGFDPEATLSTQWKERTSVSSPRRSARASKGGGEEERLPTAVVDLLNAACKIA